MSGLDEWIAGSSDGTTLLMVVAVAAVLGLRHATDPDHLAAVTTLLATGDECSGRGSVSMAIVSAGWGLRSAARRSGARSTASHPRSAWPAWLSVSGTRWRADLVPYVL